ncbi:MAG: protein kinase [Verrucomicrobiae bacterium]
MSSPDGEFFRTMIARVSPDDIVLYANSALAAYLRVRKVDLIGAPLEILADRTRGEISSCFLRPETGRASNRLVTDDQGRVFEVKTYSEGGVLDIVLDEVTTMEAVSRGLRDVSGTSVDVLNEEELRTVRQPERRHLTISRTRLNGISRLSERLVPMETRLMLSSFGEEAADAILETGCTYCQSSGSAVTGIFGAPRYFADHALRAIRAACNQIEKSARLRSELFRLGKEMPPLSCGIWTGETFVGALGASATQSYSAVGLTVDLAAELCNLARPGEVLISEFTLRNLVQTLPEGWQAIRAESEEEPDLSDFHWQGDQVQPLSPEHVRGVWLIGPGVEEDTSHVEYYADYLYAFQAGGLDEPVPVLRVVRPAVVGDSLELSTDNVVTVPFSQSLGKYKLLSVIGAGGMGKVWKGQDRYGNIVAIKVLHSTETTSDAQLKRFQREAEVMSRLPHRNICRIFEMSEFEGIQYLVMEFVDGLTLSDLLYERTRAESVGSGGKPLPDIKSLIHALREERSSRSESSEGGEAAEAPRLKRTRVLPVEQTLNIFLKVCDAVQFAHEHGVLHRDLKPGNILLREDGEPLVADFGLAKISSGDSGQSLSVSGHVVGTLENMSPEQAESSKDVDERADVYALGTVLFQMLTGRRHFEATGNIVADAQALQNHEPPRPRSINPKLDSDLEIIVLKALRNAPVERYRSIAALQADLERYRRGEVISARPVTAVELVRKLVMRNRAIAAVTTASLLVFLAGSIAAFWQITDRAKAAEAALAKAEVQEKLALENKLRADEQRKEALAAYDNLKLADTARSAAEKAKKESDEAATLAKSQTADEKQKREAEVNAANALVVGRDEKLTEAQKRIEDLQAQAAAPRAPAELPRLEPGYFEDREKFLQSARAMGEVNQSMMAFQRELNRGQLGFYRGNPEMILSRISAGLESASQAVLHDPTLPQAWMVKGRYHLACMEVAQAKESFQMAEKSAEARREANQPDMLGPDRPQELVSIADQLSKPLTNRFEKAVSLLNSTGSPFDQVASGVIEFLFLPDKSMPRRSSIGGGSPARPPGISEVAVSLMAANHAIGQVAFQSGGRDMTISGISALQDLSPLKALASVPVRIKIQGADALDWATLAALPLESLDLSGCKVGALPAGLRGFARIQNLSLKDTEFSDLMLARMARATLTALDISGTSITDISPLGPPLTCSRLQSLDIGHLSVDNVKALAFLPLSRLTLSPMMVADKASIKSLRGLRTLRILRAPDDPVHQPAAEFWRKLDAGEYDTGR